jgi:O-acetyl-ADP-ribose deacetylase
MMKDKIIIRKGDITEFEGDAIVNAANTDLVLGSGVAGAIREKGGYEIQSECNKIGTVELGQAVITPAGKLKSRFIIHAAGIHLGGKVSAKSLKEATLNSLLLAHKKGINKIAFPAIGTGVGGFPLYECAEVMIKTVLEFLEQHKNEIDEIHFILFDDQSFNIFKNSLQNV